MTFQVSPRSLPSRLRLRSIAGIAFAVPLLTIAASAASADDSSNRHRERFREPVEAPTSHIQTAQLDRSDDTPRNEDRAESRSEPKNFDLAGTIGKKLAAAGLGPYAIDVAALEGDVTLDGHVQDEPTKRRAGRIAEQVEGVRSILNRLMIRHANDHSDAHHREQKPHDNGDASSHDRKKRGLVNVNVVVTVNVQSGNVLSPQGPVDHPGHSGPPEERRPEPEARHHIERLEGVLREREQAIQELKSELDRLRQQVEDRERNERNEQRAEIQQRFEKMRQEALEQMHRMRERAPGESINRQREEFQRRLEESRRQRGTEADDSDENEAKAAEEEAVREAFESRRREQRREAEQREAEEPREDEQQTSRSPLSGGDFVQFVTSLFE